MREKKVSKIALFEGQKIRRHWDGKKELWYFSVVDVVATLTNSDNPQVYWRVLKKRLIDEGSNETVTKCNALKMVAPDGKMRLTDVLDTENILRLVQSVPSPNVAREGGSIAGNARKQIEAKTGKKVISKISFKKLKEQKKLK